MKLLHALHLAAWLSVSLGSVAWAAATSELGIAASTGDTTRIKTLRRQGQDLNRADSEGYTPLMWAALNGQVNAVSTLIHLKSNLDLQDKEGYTALMWATQNRYETVARQLVNAGADINVRDNHGYTALHWSAQDGHLGIARLLLGKGADPNAWDNEGYTPLMWAGQQGHMSVAYELLAHGAHKELEEKRGLTAEDLARNYNHPLTLATIQNFKPRPAEVTAANTPGTGEMNAVIEKPSPEISHTAVKGDVVPVKSDLEPKLVAVVGSSDLLAGASGQIYEVADLQSKLAKFDVDKNRIINGKDWRNLTMSNSRSTLAKLLYQARTGKADCPGDVLNQVLSKLDWVYADTSRRDLTLNQAWDTPSHHFEPIKW
ncbi:MAG: ankyrin repeat domain-containing protein [Candidatus Sericytochromatia bacterium]|nr:ankyrin repeat domain-containing protein [Candidatus Sericytochromatia bacterium]